jgi:hypothetical protein
MDSKQQIKRNNQTVSKRQSSQMKGGNAKKSDQRVHPAKVIQRAQLNSGSLTSHDVLHLQRTIGNRAVTQLLTGSERSQLNQNRTGLNNSSSSLPASQPDGGRSQSNFQATAGLMGGVKSGEENTFIGGRTAGELVGDVARPVGTVVGNVIGSVVGALTGISISTNTNAGPTWSNHGKFDWRVGFTTSGVSGWIVQEITNTYRAEDSAGVSLGIGPTMHYWEAWAVDATSNVTPTTAGGGNDYWGRPDVSPINPNTQGHWSMTGSVHFTTTDPATKGFALGNVTDAGPVLLSTATAPAGLGLGIARLHRYAQGTWDSTGTTPTHTGSAK